MSYASATENMRRKAAGVARQANCPDFAAESALLEASSTSGGKLYYVCGFTGPGGAITVACYGARNNVERGSGINTSPKPSSPARVARDVDDRLREKLDQRHGYDIVYRPSSPRAAAAAPPPARAPSAPPPPSPPPTPPKPAAPAKSGFDQLVEQYEL